MEERSLLDQLGFESVAGIRVRRGDDIGRAVAPRELQHGQALFAGLRAIVQAVENVAVYVDVFHTLECYRFSTQTVRRYFTGLPSFSAGSNRQLLTALR